jgi:hypothetical protein
MADTAIYCSSKLAIAEPFGVDGWGSMLIIAVSNSAAAKQLVATDPVMTNGEMAPAFHQDYDPAALMLVSETHRKIARE